MPYSMYRSNDLGTTLANLRDQAVLTQERVAQSLKEAGLRVDRDRISRIEKGDASPSDDELEKYLTILGTPEALDYRDFLKQLWNMLDRPPYCHPQREAIWKAERDLQKLADFREQPLSRQLLGMAKEYHELLLQEVKSLLELSHSINYVGAIGVGKTTAICHQTGLVLKEIKGQKIARQKKTVLETGRGRTTVCEVRIQQGNQYGIRVEPLPDTEIYNLVSDFCAGLKNSAELERKNQPGVSEEIERALKNMAFPRKNQNEINSTQEDTNSLESLSQTYEKDELHLKICNLLRLSERTRQEILFPEVTNKTELEWLQKTFLDINNGLHPDFSLPKKIEIIFPAKIFDCEDYKLQIVDTKGVDEAEVIRPDLQAYLEDKRTLNVLCSSFNSAPDLAISRLLQNLLEIGAEAILRERVIILIIARSDDAISMKNELREEVETEEEGYELKKKEVQGALKRINCSESNMPSILFFNADSNDPAEIDNALIEKVKEIRKVNASKLQELGEAINDLIDNHDRHNAEMAQKKVREDLNSLANRHEKFPPLSPIYDYLRDAMKSKHANTVRATTTHQGNWDNLNVYLYLGNGARIQAHNLSQDTFIGLREVIAQMLEDRDFQPAHSSLRVLLSRIESWRENFLKSVQVAASEAFRSQLETSSIWKSCADEYGRGLGFRDRVTDILYDWFQDPQQRDLHNILENRIENLWQKEVLQPLSKFGA